MRQQDLLGGRRPVVARDHVDAILVPDVSDAHAELADRMLEVFDQLDGIESVF